MLLQSLLLIATLAILGSALLASTLVSAKTAFHATILRQSRTAMTDATAEFISWAQENVRDNGIDQLPVWAAAPHTTLSQPVCIAPKKPSQISTSASDCKLYGSARWNITGYTNPNQHATSHPNASEATNLATAQNELRISATINILITDATGTTSYARQSREVTARIFHSQPYIVLTGERDSASEAGTIPSSEGDTAGYVGQTNDATPSESEASLAAVPAALTDTKIRTTIDCVNTLAAAPLAPTLATVPATFSHLRSYGNLAWSYETPCVPTVNINLSTAPQGYQQPHSDAYGSTSARNDSWFKGDESQSSFSY